MKISQKAKQAILIGSLCSLSYFAVYIARNILGAVTPLMLEDPAYTKDYISWISSLYFSFYAFGQLINGLVGERIPAKWMICIGLLGAGVTNFVFSTVTLIPAAAMIAYGFTGLFLSMIYGPMTKVVAENTEPIYATRCSLGYTFASFFGSPVAGLLALFLSWRGVFNVSSIAMLAMSALCFLGFTAFERKKIIQYGKYKPKEKVAGNVKVLFRHQIVKFSLISILTGIIRTSVVFWLPTYLNEYLLFTEEQSISIYSASTLVMAMTTFMAVFVYERLGRNMDLTILIMFISSSVFFVLTYFVKHPVLNIIFIVLAIMTTAGAASMMWTRYCPGLRDTGMVSSVTGFLDFLSYMAAAAANVIFAKAATALGWSNLILVWLALAVCGIVLALPYRKFFKKKEPPSELSA